MLWNKEINVKLQSYDRIHIQVTVLDLVSQEELWRFMGFYGEPKKELRTQS